MARSAPLTVETLGELPDACRRCTFWELGGPRGSDGDAVATEEVRKHAWMTTQALEFGAPGRVVRIDGRLAAWTVFAPSSAFPPRSFPTSPTVSGDALLLATLWVDPAYRGRGIGRVLVQAALKEAIHRHLAAVEVVGDRAFTEHACVLPVSWLLHEGFQVHRHHPRHPLLRVSTSRTVRWTEALGQAVDEVRERLPRRVGSPSAAPDAFEHRELT